MAAAGDGRADIGVGCWTVFVARLPKFFEEIAAARRAEFFGDHAQRILRGDEMNLADALIGFESAQHFASEDRAGSAGKCEGEVHKMHSA